MVEPSCRVLCVDAYDSFSNNIVNLLESTLKVEVIKINIDFEPSDSDWPSYLGNFHAAVLGPGPGNPLHPQDVGCMDIIWALSQQGRGIPILGICLGFQSMCLAYGATIERLIQPRHGVVQQIAHNGESIFKNVGIVESTLYNSLCVRIEAPAEYDIRLFDASKDAAYWKPTLIHPRRPLHRLKPLAWLLDRDDDFGGEDGAILMAARVEDKPIWGLQFHPESCFSNMACMKIVENWWSEVVQYWKVKGPPPLILHKPQASIETPSSTNDDCAEASARRQHYLAELSRNLSSKAYRGVEWTTLNMLGLSTAAILEICEVSCRDCVVLESGVSSGRFTIISMDSPDAFRIEHNAVKRSYQLIRHGPSSIEEYRLPSGTTIFDIISEVMGNLLDMKGPVNVPFWGGFMGFLGYDVDFANGISNVNHDMHENKETQEVDLALTWVERSVIVDNQEGLLYVQSIRSKDSLWIDLWKQRFNDIRHRSITEILPLIAKEAKDNIQRLDLSIRQSETNYELVQKIAAQTTIQIPEESTYKSQIRWCQAQNASGDSYEICLTTETSVEILGKFDFRTPFVLYRELRERNPARHGAFVQFGGLNILSASPESFLSWNRDQSFEMRPMKGTVKKTPGMTLEKATEILSSRKEIAENLMIADLIRHDMYGQVGSGNVSAEKLMHVEDHGKLYQMVTVIRAAAHGGSGTTERQRVPPAEQQHHRGVEMLQACLPPGSMTGAPKKRSCELLSQIENRKRGVYSGVLGYFDIGGGGDWSVVIRSAFKYDWKDKLDDNGRRRPDVWRIGAGGAVTCLSSVEGEWQEMKAKLDTILDVFRVKR